ncbi:SGNH/GDSL hydrolase family protein [Endozoicomonas elysicola]|uniref:SGNH hydrolase-type esterase domain-containing protein n=1 Tax=Endozoicomonas elysicola TaxID=305900 RepID=A0A081KAA0_9GAMM|nr:SGNH/GDSL hydrolase family protein [Endozoicomonas elysicola]KEI71076.1 hypothetical protein GV64_10250 [Endozoicomonas elysicola]
MYVFMMLLSILSGFLLLVSIAFYQGMQLKRNALRLPEATGKRLKTSNADFSILHIGESPVAGVGVEDIRQGLTHRVVSQLSHELSVGFDWEILAKNGARIIDSLSFDAVIEEPDVLIVSFGVNDTTKFTRGSMFNKNMKACVRRFSVGHTRVFVTSIPKINQFPLLPPPLSWVLGVKAYLLDRQLQQLCEQEGWVYIQSETALDASLMAEDGYHPNESGYQVWADIITDRISEGWKARAAFVSRQ